MTSEVMDSGFPGVRDKFCLPQRANLNLPLNSWIVDKPEVGLAGAKTPLESDAPSSGPREIWLFFEFTRVRIP